MTQIKRSIKLLSAALIIGSSVLALMACSGGSRVRKPAELTTVTNQFELTPVWSTNVGSSDPFNFHPVVAGNAVYAASHGGNLVKVD